MCPLRFVLVFFSVVLAGFFAWRAVDSSPELISEDSTTVEPKEKEGLGFKRKMCNGFWMFVDMASGRHLWRNLRVLSSSQ
ncbi:hypothetical protein Bca52824_092858 [Brassica carinata]|uniref:Methyltransferase n=1 Tax=Brassica carinata TaxID=52824 RepID=A0A8X7P8M0_BRACI|nr:hypothetical protein Bca52824_092858 [Brassica carinata]